jgi:secreted trypsin-like serine protease
MLSSSPRNVMTSPISPAKLAGVLVLLAGAATACLVPGLAAGQTLHAEASGRQAARAHEAIIGGTTARTGTFASVAEIIDIKGRRIGQCTGTVVAPSLVLTAGHCAENIRTGAVNAASGYRVLTEGAGGAPAERQLSTASGVLVYEGFLRKVDAGDAALLVLSTPTTAPAVRLASSDADALRAGSSATITGWGDTFFAQRLPTESLHWADTVVQGDHWCTHNAPPFYASEELCTIDPPSYATGVCFGDSGGPLLAPSGEGEEPVEIGIAVHVYGRCSTRRPSVFTRVDRIAAWVDTWIAAYRPPPPAPTTTPPPAT